MQLLVFSRLACRQHGGVSAVCCVCCMVGFVRQALLRRQQDKAQVVKEGTAAAAVATV
jgi:hypothetical protein